MNEDYKNINKFKNIKYLFLNYIIIIKKDSIIKLISIKNNKFQLKEKYFNSYYFEKK